MTSPDWYAPEHAPLCKLRVRARLHDGREVVVAGDVSRGQHRWYMAEGHALAPLPRGIRCWQPLSEAWTWPRGFIPPALAGELGDDVAALAKVMEADRERPGLAARDSAPRGQWWRDADLVKYEPQGEVTPSHGEARLMRALALDRSMPMGAPSDGSHAAALVDLRQSLADVLREEPDVDWVPTLRSLPQDERDYLTAMGWLVELSPGRRELRILLARARTPPVTWLWIGDRASVSPQRAEQIFGSTVASVVAAANGSMPRTRQRLSALQRRNREART